PAVAAHAPYTCSDELLIKSRELADKYNIVFNIHLSETENEVKTILKEKGKRPTEYLNNLGILKDKTVLAHCVHINRDEAKLIKSSGASVAHNPQSNMKLASGIAPINLFRSLGINVTIGTDGVCSNNNLDILEEGREAALLAKVYEKDPTVLDDEYILKCLTINGAKALGIEEKTGSIEIGKDADIVIIATDSAHMIPLYNPYSQLVYSANQSDVRDVMIRGKWVMKDRKIISFDEEEIKGIGEKWKNRIKK
ncbi:MAG: amidohydrolase family protein, partial [Proteobacteria bacterium]|nr:amidohydrolase family protein [Pseudomonadota bacterium]